MRALPLDRREEGSRAREEGETRALFFANCPPSFFEFLCVSFFFCSFFAVSTSLILSPSLASSSNLFTDSDKRRFLHGGIVRS